MLDVRAKNSNIQFCARNSEIRNAERILRKIKSEFPASSTFIPNLLFQKRKLKANKPDAFVSMQDMIESYYQTSDIGTKLTNNYLAQLRKVQEYYVDDDYRYCDSLVWGINKFHVMNCKENAELAYLMAKINGYKDCHCVNLARRHPADSFAGLGHTVLLINQELSPKMRKLNKFYIESVDKTTAFTPSRKSIVVDPLFGIVDYWENAVQSYKKIFPRILSTKDICAGAREAIISTSEDIETFKCAHPEFIFKSRTEKNKSNLFTRIINYLRKKL